MGALVDPLDGVPGGHRAELDAKLFSVFGDHDICRVTCNHTVVLMTGQVIDETTLDFIKGVVQQKVFISQRVRNFIRNEAVAFILDDDSD